MQAIFLNLFYFTMILRLIIDYSSTVVISSPLGSNVKYVAYFPLFSGFSLAMVCMRIYCLYLTKSPSFTSFLVQRIYKSMGHKSNVQKMRSILVGLLRFFSCISLSLIMYLHIWPPRVAIFLDLRVWEAFGAS